MSGRFAGAARVYIASRDADALVKAADAIAPDRRCIAITADLLTEAGCVALAEAVSTRERTLDILVNNSGASWVAALDAVPEAAWDKVFQLNLKAPFFLSRGFAPLMERSASDDGPTRIINIGSVAGEIADAMNAYPYGLSKGALHHLTRMLAKDLAPRGVAVTAIAPGRFPSKMTKAISDDPERFEAEKALVPLGRWGRADDIGGAAVFLASHAGAYMTGSVLHLDGGTRLMVA